MGIGAQQAELTRARAAAEACSAEARGDHGRAERQRNLALSSETLRGWYEARAAELEQADADYREWEHATEGSRRVWPPLRTPSCAAASPAWPWRRCGPPSHRRSPTPSGPR